MGPLSHELARQYKGAAKRRYKTSPGMKRKVNVSMRPRPGVCETSASEMKPAPYARGTYSIGAAPRPFERRPVPEGRKFRRWRQPERLSERAKRASCAEGSDRRNFQAVVTGRLPFLLLRFLSVRHGKKMKGPWNRIPEMETVVCFGHVRKRNVSVLTTLQMSKICYDI